MNQTAYPEIALSQPTRTRSAPRLDFLDALRGIAAILVVVQHVGERYTSWIPWFAQHWFNFGRFGVTVFFLVSGFVIPYAFEKDNSVRSFWIKRIFRLYPLYWLSLALTVAAGIEPAAFRASHLVRNILVNVTMLQGFAGIPNASQPFWTLFIEMAFYLAFTVWFLLRLHRKTLLWAWTGAAGFFALSVLAPLLLGMHTPVTMAFCFLAILVGSVLYRHYSAQVGTRPVAALLGAVILLAAASSYLNFFRFPSAESVSGTSAFLSWTCAFLFFTALLSLRGRKFSPALLWLGKISYSLYLLHAVVLDTLPDVGSKALGFGLVLAISLVVSAFTFKYLERPCVAFGHRIATKVR
jgi:peptidoglycan/LPS O-acetylase OafA/YrhL